MNKRGQWRVRTWWVVVAVVLGLVLRLIMSVIALLLGLIPAVGWPYWTPNLLAGIGLALLWRRNCARRQMAASPHR